MRLVFIARLRAARGEREEGERREKDAASGDKCTLAEPVPHVPKIHPRYKLNEVAGYRISSGPSGCVRMTLFDHGRLKPTCRSDFSFLTESLTCIIETSLLEPGRERERETRSSRVRLRVRREAKQESDSEWRNVERCVRAERNKSP